MARPARSGYTMPTATAATHSGREPAVASKRALTTLPDPSRGT